MFSEKLGPVGVCMRLLYLIMDYISILACGFLQN